MRSKFIEVEEEYDGRQLVSLRNYLKHKILGDSIVAWVGPCNIPFEHMVDGEDVVAGAVIRGDRMLHFIVEKFDCRLFAAVTLQRLLASIVKDVLSMVSNVKFRREGDDLYVGESKLSISIATQSPVSSLIHFAVNVTNAGTPVKTIALEDLQVDPRKLAEEVMRIFCLEVDSIQEATTKVRWVN